MRRRRRAFRQHADEGAAARALHAEPAALPGVPVQAAAAALRHGGGPAAEQGPAGAQPGDRAARHRAAPLRAHHRLLLQLRPGVFAAGNTDGVATVPSAGRAEGLRIQRHDHQFRQPHTLRLRLQHRGQRHGDCRLGDQQRLLSTSDGQALLTPAARLQRRATDFNQECAKWTNYLFLLQVDFLQNYKTAYFLLYS